MKKTIVGKDIDRPVVGYMLNAELSLTNQRAIASIQENLTHKFGPAIWRAPAQSLHITLFDWLAPLVDYGRDKTDIFEEIYTEYDSVVSNAISKVTPISLRINRVKAGASAVWIEGDDQGQFRQIRGEFLSNIKLLPQTKLPPTIIHSTIARYRDEIDLEDVQKVVDGLQISLTQEISAFRLVRETVDPMLEFETIKTYQLTSMV